ncbi:SDR family NAD(P)-dependent oxidoreductase [Neorhizobium lilium]|uniref:SDR family NAD(P)-dependent oxidoreductase n=1 Tax=Neorhizobium lilium TaxID=2503024 RepID=A0A3S3U472_9HYPH|nr:SDR family NAD(P)-dependent oxidoreductase [Neorhizobium lilium]RWX81534.1 SDR family NAD(P)-dependent oxidoreductase [Neorhizobium lilium]
MANRPKILITGATDGIGQRAAVALARQGADLILTARNRQKADKTRSLIKAAAPGTRVDVHHVDFSDLGAVVSTGRQIARQHPHIDVLINNAGLHAFEQRITREGFAEMIAVNYLAPWLLTQTLRETLMRSAPARIITVGSQASRQSRGLDIEKDLTDTATFTARGSSRIYGRSKLLDIMFSLELARQLDGTGIVANCLCPGFNVTGLGRELGFSGPLAKLLNWLRIGDPERGAHIITRLATDPAFGSRSGAYVSVKNAADLKPFPPADDEQTRRALWRATEILLARFI